MNQDPTQLVPPTQPLQPQPATPIEPLPAPGLQPALAPQLSTAISYVPSIGASLSGSDGFLEWTNDSHLRIILSTGELIVDLVPTDITSLRVDQGMSMTIKTASRSYRVDNRAYVSTMLSSATKDTLAAAHVDDAIGALAEVDASTKMNNLSRQTTLRQWIPLLQSHGINTIDNSLGSKQGRWAIYVTIVIVVFIVIFVVVTMKR